MISNLIFLLHFQFWNYFLNMSNKSVSNAYYELAFQYIRRIAIKFLQLVVFST